MKWVKKYWWIVVPFGLVIYGTVFLLGKAMQEGGIKGWLSNLFKKS